MAVDEVRLADDVEKGAVGGPRFKTTIVQLNSGHEQRNIDWAQQRGDWSIGYGIDSLTDLQAVIDFFYARRGRAHGFRFKDWSDFEITPQQNIGVGTGGSVAYQIFKRYSSGGRDYDRTIVKIVAATFQAFIDGIPTGSGSLDFDTGIYTVSAGGGLDVAVTCEFDVPVRFDTDKLNISLETFSAGEIPQIPIIELRQDS